MDYVCLYVFTTKVLNKVLITATVFCTALPTAGVQDKAVFGVCDPGIPTAIRYHSHLARKHRESRRNAR